MLHLCVDYLRSSSSVVVFVHMRILQSEVKAQSVVLCFSLCLPTPLQVTQGEAKRAMKSLMLSEVQDSAGRAKVTRELM